MGGGQSEKRPDKSLGHSKKGIGRKSFKREDGQETGNFGFLSEGDVLEAERERGGFASNLKKRQTREEQSKNLCYRNGREEIKDSKSAGTRSAAEGWRNLTPETKPT